ncbi:glycosyltransferase family 39 protein [Mycolicibacterium brumae]|nr:glycosyltransferase family 39 protein [Mycolicibacterium brumae]UWW07161.1 glycosyltransferase family 39 protein [Mycolicibacterium brumae]
MASLLLGTAVLYLWSLNSLGWSNQFYAAAVQAGTQDLKAWLFGSLDSGNAITVDKPPAALWVMVASARIFGFNSWSMLAPQALMGVGSVWLMYAAVRRTSGPVAGLLAGAILALTPVAALMFRYNNPDALLVLLLVAAAYCVIRALDGATTLWVALSGVALGFAFLAKLLQAVLVAPALALVVLVAAPIPFWGRVRALAAGLAAMVVSAGWYVALVDLWPADSRPYIGGSTDNSLLQLTLGYNGLGRVFGGLGNPSHTGAGMPGPGDGSGGAGRNMFGGSPGLGRIFSDAMGGEIAWLLPAALIGLVAGLWLTRRAPRTDPTRAALLLWGGWTVLTAAVFSAMKGIFHPYYAIALAPGIAGLLAVSATQLWSRRAEPAVRAVLSVMVAGTGAWAFALLARTPDWQPWLRPTVLVAAIAVALAILVRPNSWGRGLAVAAVLTCLAAPAAYTLATVTHVTHGGPVPASGPARADERPGGPGGGPFPGEGQFRTADTVEAMLRATDNRWAAATVGSMTAGDMELNTGTAVMAIGGFMGADDAPTLEQFQRYVADGEVRYFLIGKGPDDGRKDQQQGDGSTGSLGGAPGGPPPGFGADGDNAASKITEWVKATFAEQQIDGMSVYDLQGPTR